MNKSLNIELLFRKKLQKNIIELYFMGALKKHTKKVI